MFYENFAECYDNMIDWPTRLEREKDDLRALFQEYNIKTALDVGCGTGIHSIIFSKMGLNIIGIDSSQSMLDIAKKNADKYDIKNLKFIKGEFTRLDKVVRGKYDAILCLGNSLPHLVDDEDIKIALRQFYKLLRPDGVCILQLVHFDHYLDSSDSAVAVTDGLRKGREVTFRRHYEFKGTKVIFHVSVYSRKKRELIEDHFTPLNAIRRALLEKFMGFAGFTEITEFADFSRKELQEKDRSLVIIAKRPLHENADREELSR